MTRELPVPVEVDPRTGIWSVDSFPMILIPRHYWSAVMEAVESRLGVEAAAEIYFSATHRAAYIWCEEEAQTHSLSGVEVFHHYLSRMSDRGWGRFEVADLDEDNGTARVRLTHSAIALARGNAGRNVCHSFNGAFCGALEYVASSGGGHISTRSSETQCLANGAECCLFQVTASNGEVESPP